MDGILRKPYEISIWEDNIIESEGQTHIEEKKLMIIGSDTMDAPNKVFEPVLKKNINGEVNLTFSLQYKYFDPVSEKIIINPFSSFLINERKIKLHYDDEWYEFIIKNHTESSDGMKWTYECVDAFVLELSKTGYNLEFSPEINNNQGTIQELAEAVLDGTDWQVDPNSYADKQKIEEPIYYATLNMSNIDKINIVNANTGEPVVNKSEILNENIFIFYSYISNKSGKFVQFTLQSDVQEMDDKGNYIATNYRIEDELTYTEVEIGNETTITFKKGSFTIITVGQLEVLHHSYRLIYNQLTTYDPIKERTVDIYDVKYDDEHKDTAYKYTDYVYSTSDVVVSYVTNGENFEAIDSGAPQGWTQYNDFSMDDPIPVGIEFDKLLPQLSIVTYPRIDDKSTFSSLANYAGVRGFLESKFNGVLADDYLNTIFNSGIQDNASMITSISQGEKFVFRWRGGMAGTSGGDLSSLPSNIIGCIVAKYTKVEKVIKNGDIVVWSGYVNKIDPSGIILRFEGSETEKNNIIENGYFRIEHEKRIYYVDDVAQEPSTKYIYIDSTDQLKTQYVWDNKITDYVVKDNSYLNYRYLVAEAQQTVTKAELSDPTVNIGIFIYLRNSANKDNYYYFEDVQLTRYIEDANQQPVIMGNIPTATSFATDYYYLKPKSGTAAEDIETYTSIDTFANRIGVPKSNITPVYNEKSVKILSITESKSNCFNILQTIAETFETWLRIKVEHESNGNIKIDENTGLPIKWVSFSPFAGNDNLAGFKYGINLQSIERTVESSEIVTKLIVDSAQSEYVDEGVVSIQLADENPNGESFILNFDYFYNQGLIEDKEACQNDILQFNSQVKNLNKQISDLEKLRRNLSASLTKIQGNRTAFSELVNTAKNTVNDALARFKQATGKDYKDYEGKDIALGDLYRKASEVSPYHFQEGVEYYILNASTGAYDKVQEPIQEDFFKYYVHLINIFEVDSIYDIIGEIYNSYTIINNYEGVLTSTNAEYEKIRKELYGNPEYTFSVSTAPGSDSSKLILRVYLTDYVVPFEFQVYQNDALVDSYATTTNKKTFDITVLSGTTLKIVITKIPTGYNGPNEIIVDPQTVAQYKLVPTQFIPSKEDDIKKLQEDKKKIINEFFNKYQRFIQEGNWNSTDYIDSNLYYLDALQVSNNSAQPKVSYSINVVEVSEIEGLEHYNFDVGDKTYIEDEEFFGWNSEKNAPAREEVIVSEVEWHLDEPNNNSITVQNFKTQFEDLFQRLTATVQTVQYNEAAYAKTSTIVDADGSLNQDLLVAALDKAKGRQFALTSDGSVYIDGDAIHIQNLTNTANHVIINSEGIRISDDGGQNWSTAISGRGINIGDVVAGTIDTDLITIGGKENPSFRWDNLGLSAYKREQDESYDLATYVRFDQYGLYGVKNNTGFKPSSLDDVKNKAHFAVTWDGFFIKNSYAGGGRVEITSNNDFRVLNTDGNDENEKIKIGALEWGTKENPIYTPIPGEAPRLYGIRIRNNKGDQVFKTTDEGDIEITGKITATSGEIGGLVVDDDKLSMNHIVLEPGVGIYSNYASPYPFLISDTDGDATFNNITARGAIKTAVFEYAEIQAVGGVFLFRPSSTIKNAENSGSNDLKIRVEKPHLFKVNDWCKVSNYINQTGEPSAEGAISNNGLIHVYRVSLVDPTDTRILTLENAQKLITDGIITSKDSLVGGSLVNMGHYENEKTSANYGIGVNSSDNTVNLPRRAISLFETTINPDPEKPVKVSYDYRGILGTLPSLSDMSGKVDENIYTLLQKRQGIYTDNMYIGDKDQYLAFYTENQQKKLQIKANQIIFEDPNNPNVWTNVADIEGGEGIALVIVSSNGTIYNTSVINTELEAKIYKNGIEMTEEEIVAEKWQIVWYFEGDIIYIQTKDTTPIQGKIYYSYNVSQNRYVVVENPTGDPSEQGWYERNNTFIGLKCKAGGVDMVNITVQVEDIEENQEGGNNGE